MLAGPHLARGAAHAQVADDEPSGSGSTPTSRLPAAAAALIGWAGDAPPLRRGADVGGTRGRRRADRGRDRRAARRSTGGGVGLRRVRDGSGSARRPPAWPVGAPARRTGLRLGLGLRRRRRRRARLTRRRAGTDRVGLGLDDRLRLGLRLGLGVVVDMDDRPRLGFRPGSTTIGPWRRPRPGEDPAGGGAAPGRADVVTGPTAGGAGHAPAGAAAARRAPQRRTTATTTEDARRRPRRRRSSACPGRTPPRAPRPSSAAWQRRSSRGASRHAAVGGGAAAAPRTVVGATPSSGRSSWAGQDVDRDWRTRSPSIVSATSADPGSVTVAATRKRSTIGRGHAVHLADHPGPTGTRPPLARARSAIGPVSRPGAATRWTVMPAASTMGLIWSSVGPGRDRRALHDDEVPVGLRALGQRRRRVEHELGQRHDVGRTGRDAGDAGDVGLAVRRSAPTACRSASPARSRCPRRPCGRAPPTRPGRPGRARGDAPGCRR